MKAGRPHDFVDALGIVKNPDLRLDFRLLEELGHAAGIVGRAAVRPQRRPVMTVRAGKNGDILSWPGFEDTST